MTGHVYRRFAAKNGEPVILRSIRWEDLDAAVKFINELVSEREEDPDLGIITDKKQSRDSEAEWLAERLVEVEGGNAVHVVAEVNGELVANAHVSRGKSSDEYHHGILGISVSKKYRNLGIGLEVMKTLVDECRKKDFKTIELEVFANNETAIHVYERAGFKQVGKIPKKICRNGRFIDAVVMTIET